MIKDAAIRGLSALSVSCTIRRDAPVAGHISVLYLLLLLGRSSTQDTIPLLNVGLKLALEAPAKRQVQGGRGNRRSKELAANTSQRRMKRGEESSLRGKLNVKETWRK
jgi:hypothetical protein